MSGKINGIWRFTAVERKILRCVAEGKTADFSEDKVGDELLTVSGKFISDLWLDLIEGAVLHPRGISLKALKILDQIKLEGARQTSAGRSCLLGFIATDCIFEKTLEMGNIRAETLGFDHCKFGDTGELTNPADTDSMVHISLGGCQIDGSLLIINCELTGGLHAEFSSIHGEILAERSTFKAGFSLWGAKVDGALKLHWCQISKGPYLVGLAIPNTKFEGRIAIFRSRICGGIHAANTAAPELEIRFSTFSKGGVANFENAQIAGNATLQRVKSTQHFSLAKSGLGGDCSISQSVFQDGLSLLNAELTGACYIWSTQFAHTNNGSWAVNLQSLKVSAVTLHKIVVNGNMSVKAIQSRGEINVSQCNLGARRPTISCIESKNFYLLECSDLECGVAAVFQNCSINSRWQFSRANIRGNLFIRNCFVNRSERTGWSIDLENSRVGSIVFIDYSFFSSGISAPLLECGELQICANVILPGGSISTGAHYSIWASDCIIRRRISFGARLSENGPPIRNTFTGKVELFSCKIGEALKFASTTLLMADETLDRRLGIALGLARIEVNGSAKIAARDYSFQENDTNFETPPQIEGCVDLDNSRIRGSLLLHEASIKAIGEIRRPLSHFETEERVSKRKRGVALSIRSTTIEGKLEIGTPQVTGLVDMREARIDMIADGGGDRWAKAGLAPGHLLLDGLSYRDLDDVHDRSQDAENAVNNTSDAATRRLEWLRLQYPDGKPTADTFVPQPYEQLASIFASEGNERARRQIQIAKRDMQRLHGRLGKFERCVQWLLRVISKYGYSPGRAIISSMLYLAIGVITAALLDAKGMLMLASTDFPQTTPFDPLVYALDSAIPIIDLNQDSSWILNPEAIGSPVLLATLMSAKSVYEVVGMLLVSITILTLTGTLRDKE